jgi:acyl transferase domain-containing protein/surfactin synthase thioesterase subunit
VSESEERLLRLLREARRALEGERARRSEPIAVVGIGCRFPGGVSGPEGLWQALISGRDATSEVPADRWDGDGAHDPDHAAPGRGVGRRGGFLDGIDAFEPEFFGISSREAASVDPQQRLLLEVAWEALEHAGIPPDRLREGSAGVWVGLASDDHAGRVLRSDDPTRIDAYSVLGCARSVAAGRMAHALDLHGPVMQVDTSGSSSLVAVHLACQSLRAAECDTALVGAVNLMLSPETTIALGRLGVLSGDGRCKAFDAAADGYGRGEGCGVVVLKRASDARAAGDRVLALLRGSALNHDGRGQGWDARSGRAQESVIRAALRSAGVDGSTVGYVEAHGSGVARDDVSEAIALGAVYGPGRPSQRPLLVGSVKGNLGHLEAAAGMAGLIKAIGALRHHQIPPQLHLRTANPRIPWARLGLRVATEPTAWPSEGAPRRAAVSSFGMSGTNAHLIVEEEPCREGVGSALPARRAELLVLSARTEGSLQSAAERLRGHLEPSSADLALRDLAYSLATTRTLLDRRRVLVVDSVRALSSALATLTSGRAGDSTAPATLSETDSRRRLAWLFRGEGVGPQMGLELAADWPVFRAAMERAWVALDAHLDRPLRDVMSAPPASDGARLLAGAPYVDAALFALEWALASLWTSWGLRPDVIAGDRAGECVAACVAGVLSLEDGARLTCARGSWLRPPPDGFRTFAASVVRRPPSMPFVSSFFAPPGNAEEAPSGNSRDPLESLGLPIREALRARGATLVLEIGPGVGQLASIVGPGAPRSIAAAPSAAAPASETAAALHSLACWIEQGGPVDWRGVFPAGGRRVDLPTYSWQRRRYSIPAQRAAAPPADAVEFSAHVPARWVPSDTARGASHIHRTALAMVGEEVNRLLGRSSGAPPPLDEPLADLGFDSRLSLELRRVLEARSGVILSAALVDHHPTVRAIGEHLFAEAIDPTGAPAGVPAGSVARWERLNFLLTPRARLFCFMPAGGSASLFVPLRRLSQVGIEIHAVAHDRSRLPEAADGERYLRDAVATLRRWSDRPQVLFGHSLGGLFAWRVLQELLGEKPASAAPPVLMVQSASAFPASMIDAHARGDVPEPLRSVLGADVPTAEYALAFDFALWRSMSPHADRPVALPIAAFVGRDDHLVSPAMMALWGERTTGGFSMTVLPGGHFYLSQEGPRKALLDHVKRMISAVIGPDDSETNETGQAAPPGGPAGDAADGPGSRRFGIANGGHEE